MSLSGKHRALKGIEDILPPDIFLWQKAEETARRIFAAYGFREMRPPIIESTEVFLRSIGETTDIVEKEMYTFPDKAGRSITLRPEGTAPVVRCYVERNLHNLPAPQKFYYLGPMFRYERPQRGRFRQFYQIGAEAFGSEGPAIDAEMISMLRLFFDSLGVAPLEFEINSIGCGLCRPFFKDALVGFFGPRLELLCPDCVRRHSENPLRILDCKVQGCIEARRGAPTVSGHLCGACTGHFEALKGLLEILGISFRVNHEMVRGLDYYTRTTFEVTSRGLGAQKAVAAGGRYDRLVGEFGGPETPAIGFAIGMERLVGLMKEEKGDVPRPDVFFAVLGEGAEKEALRMSEALRQRGFWAELGGEGASLKSQMRRADRLGAAYVLIVGEDELRGRTVKWKRLRDGIDGEMAMDEACSFEWRK